MTRGSIRLLVAALAATLVLGGTALAADHLLLPSPDDDGLTLLLLGSDEGPMRSQDPLSGRADGIQLLFVAGDRQHATFVSIPRDSWIPVTGRGTTRINACLVAGPEACVSTVEQEFGIDVDAYLLTSMRGFANAVGDFGGLVVDVPTAVSDGGQAIPSAGEQRLSGSQALTYGRDRKNRSGGDFARSQAQAEMLALAHAEVAGAGELAAALEAVSVLRRHTVTDLSGAELIRLGFEAMRLPPENVERTLAPGRIGTAGAASVVYLEDQAYDIVRDAAEDGRLGDG